MLPPVHSLRPRYGELSNPCPSTSPKYLACFPQYTHYQRNYVQPEKPQEVEEVDGEEEADTSPSTSDTSSSDSSSSEDEEEEEDEDDRCGILY